MDRMGPMKVLINHEYKANKKEPFGELLRRLHGGVEQAGLPVSYQFAFADSSMPGGVSAVGRAIKKFPHLAASITTNTLPGSTLSGPQVISGDESHLTFAGVAEIADGIPRSLPFDSASIRFFSPAFGTMPVSLGAPHLASVCCGIGAQDSWWVNGRMRGLRAGYIVEVQPGSREVPLPEGPLGAFLSTLGKPKKTTQFPIKDDPAGEAIPLSQRLSSVPPQLAEVGQRIRAALPELIAGAKMPNEITAAQAPTAAHPLKPTLEKHFRPLGYSCQGGSGTFTLRRRTAEHHVVEVSLDVGTWSRHLIATFCVHVPDFRWRFPMPAAPGMTALQCSIGDAERWEKIVENLAALTLHLDREIVPEISATAGPAPEWFDVAG